MLLAITQSGATKPAASEEDAVVTTVAMRRPSRHAPSCRGLTRVLRIGAVTSQATPTRPPQAPKHRMRRSACSRAPWPGAGSRPHKPTASTTLANSTSSLSPVVLTIRPLWRAIAGSMRSRGCSQRHRPPGSPPIGAQFSARSRHASWPVAIETVEIVPGARPTLQPVLIALQQREWLLPTQGCHQSAGKGKPRT